VLPNGLTVLVEPNRSAPVVAAVTHVKAGYFDEPDEWVGISHVLEHMYFKGTARRGPGALARETQLLGGYLNAGTIYDKTVYYTVLPAAPGSLEQAVDLQADALMCARLDGDELARELEVIVQEAKRKLDNPSAVAGETLFESLFAQHRIRRWRIGTEDVLRTFGAEDLRSYYRTRYTPERTIVAIVGDLDVDAALDLAERTYGAWQTDEPHRDTSPSETDPPPPSLRVMHGDIERPIAVVGWRTVDTLHPDAVALDLAGAVLGSGRGSWLSREVRAPGLASSARGFHYTTSEVGVFELAFEGDAARLDDAVARGLELMAELRSDGPSGTDMERVRSLLTAQWSRRLETMDGRATLWGECEALGGYALADRFYGDLLEATAEQVTEAARRYLEPSQSAAVMYGGAGFHTRYEDGPWAPTPAAGGGMSAVHVPEPAPPGRTRREKTPSTMIGEVTHVALPGVDILIRPKTGTGLMFLGAYVLGLRNTETADTAGVSALLARSALRGAAGSDSEQLALAAEMLGGAMAPSVSADAVGWGITVRAPLIRRAAALIHGVARDPTLRAEDLDIERSLQASDAKRLRDDMFGYPIRRTLALALPRSPYGLSTLGDPENVPNLSDDLVRQWARELPQRRLTLIAVGDLAVEEMVESLRVFDAWAPADPTAPLAPDDEWEVARDVETRDKAQSAIAMAFPSASYGSPDRMPLIVAGSYLSGLAGRLFEELREKRSLAYTVAAMPWLKRNVGAMLAYIATSPEREDEAREAMVAELVATGAGEIAEGDVERARSYAAGVLQLRLQSGHAVAGEIMDGWIHGELESLPRLADDLRAVTAEQVGDVAGRVFRPEERSEFVVRGTGVG
jgi:zinc protease